MRRLTGLIFSGRTYYAFTPGNPRYTNEALGSGHRESSLNARRVRAPKRSR